MLKIKAPLAVNIISAQLPGYNVISSCFCKPQKRPWLTFLTNVAYCFHIICLLTLTSGGGGSIVTGNKAVWVTPVDIFLRRPADIYICFFGEGAKTSCFSREARPSQSMTMATKTGLLSQTVMFSELWPSVFVPKLYQNITRTLWQERERNREFHLNNRKVAT